MNKLLFVLIAITMVSCNNNFYEDEMNISATLLGDNLQLIVVRSKQPADQKAKMYLYERKRVNDKFMCSDSFDVMIGRNGFAWDNSSTIKHGFQKVKHEGDGCSPAGIFTLGNVFSYHEMKNLKMPFRQVDENDLCVDDENSVYYNKIIDSTNSIHDYNSFENMKRNDDLYEYGVFVNYNTDRVVKGNGSCIFLHVWKDENTATSGCTAMSKENILELLQWLDQDKKPILIQYPEM